MLGGLAGHPRQEADLLVAESRVEAGGLERHRGHHDAVAAPAADLLLGGGHQAGAVTLAAQVLGDPE